MDIKKNVKKDLLVFELAEEIAKNFALLLEIMNDQLYQLLLKFKDRMAVPAREMQGHAKSVEYLIRRGYLFQCLSHDDEVLLLPEELQHILDRLAESEMGKDTERKIKRNTTICKIGTNILYAFGVMEESHFHIYLHALYYHWEKGRLDVVVDLSRLRFTDRYDKKAIFQKANLVFQHYAQYAGQVKRVLLIKSNYTRYSTNFYSYYSVFDPYNVYFAQQNSDDLDFLPFCCRELLSERFPDQKAKEIMSKYLIKHFRSEPIMAHMLVEEWSCYIKNGENKFFYLDNIIERLNYNSSVQIDDLLLFVSHYFANELNQWLLKGHTPNELRGIEPVEQNKQVNRIETVAGEQERTTKIGRNNPCSCGSGKKYKKCCGR